MTASSDALKSQVTKLSLLTINSPFTPSAIGTVLSALLESVLPSLVTASLLVTPGEYTEAFHTEIQVLTKTALKELSALIGEVKRVAGIKDAQTEESELVQGEKDTVTAATGRVWDSCDSLSQVAGRGVVGFVIRRAEEWRDLVKDAVREIEEWDPDEDDGFFEDFLGDSGPDGLKVGEDEDDEDEEEDNDDHAALHAQKKSTLRVLKPVAQLFPAIISNRLKNAGDAPLSSIGKLESLMLNLESIPENIDEIAGALYEENLEKAGQYLTKTKSYATKAVDSMVLPWNAKQDGEDQGDKFTVWSKTWLKVIEEVNKPVDTGDI